MPPVCTSDVFCKDVLGFVCRAMDLKYEDRWNDEEGGAWKCNAGFTQCDHYSEDKEEYECVEWGVGFAFDETVCLESLLVWSAWLQAYVCGLT